MVSSSNSQSVTLQDDNSDPNRIIFYIPKLTAGSVIGKGASNLKSIMDEFDVTVYIDREEYQNMRKVVIRSDNPTNNLNAKERVLQNVQEAQAQATSTNNVDTYGAGSNATVFGADDVQPSSQPLAAANSSIMM